VEDRVLQQILQPSKLIDQKSLDEAVQLAKDQNISLYDAILEKDLVADEALGIIMADALKVPFVNLQKVTVDPSILNIIPEVVAKKHHLIAFTKDHLGLKVAIADPSDLEQIEFLKKKVGEEVIVYFATKHDIENTFHLYRKDIKKSFEDVISSSIEEAGRSIIKEPPIATLVSTLVEYAYQNRASDIHLEPTEKEMKVRLRIDGILHDIVSIPKNLEEQVISRIKVLANLRTDEHLSAQDGKMKFKTDTSIGSERDLDIRVSIVPIVEGEKIVLRLLSERSRQFSLENLGMDKTDLAKVKTAFSKPYGMILSTGPTGCGKTTTVYAVLKILNTREKNIATIEDPVEYDIEGVNQIQVNPKTNLTFAEGLRSILRQDPDIIFVGEIRDPDTANIAVNSAMTGHLVLSTLHTNDAATALPRLLEMKVEPYLVSSTANVIIAQRLVRRICTKCVISKETSVQKLVEQFGEPIIDKHFGKKETIRTFIGAGCSVCHQTGYQGRIGIFEVLEITDSIRMLINASADSETIKRVAVQGGMTTMVDDGLTKVVQGITTVEEVLRATKT